MSLGQAPLMPAHWCYGLLARIMDWRSSKTIEYDNGNLTIRGELSSETPEELAFKRGRLQALFWAIIPIYSAGAVFAVAELFNWLNPSAPWIVVEMALIMLFALVAFGSVSLSDDIEVNVAEVVPQ